MTRGGSSKIMEVLFEILKCHFIFVDLGVFETVFDIIQTYCFADHLKHPHDILWTQISFLLPVQTVK